MNTRDLYKKVMGPLRPSEAKMDDLIQASIDLKNMIQTPGWRRVAHFMTVQRQGTQQYMERETTLVNAFSLVWLFNTFIKYLGVLLENRAYNRIDSYVRITIARGEEQAEKRRKQADKDEADAARERAQSVG